MSLQKGMPVPEIKGNLSEAGLAGEYAIVVARWNDFITDRLLSGALAAFAMQGIQSDRLTIAFVPGAFELGSTAKKMASSGKYRAVVCLGCVIRGATPHFDQVAGQAARLVAQAGYDTGLPVIFGVLTTDSIEQAIERAGTKAGNKGFEAAQAALEMVALYANLPA